MDGWAWTGLNTAAVTRIDACWTFGNIKITDGINGSQVKLLPQSIETLWLKPVDRSHTNEVVYYIVKVDTHVSNKHKLSSGRKEQKHKLLGRLLRTTEHDPLDTIVAPQ